MFHMNITTNVCKPEEGKVVSLDCQSRCGNRIEMGVKHSNRLTGTSVRNLPGGNELQTAISTTDGTDSPIPIP